VALRAWVATGGLKDLRVFTEEPRFWNVQGPRAWISIPATFTFVMDGKSDSESGVYAIVLTQSGAAWKVRSFSWATTAFALGR
jgi:hypothetical protein